MRTAIYKKKQDGRRRYWKESDGITVAGGAATDRLFPHLSYSWVLGSKTCSPTQQTDSILIPLEYDYALLVKARWMPRFHFFKLA